MSILIPLIRKPRNKSRAFICIFYLVFMRSGFILSNTSITFTVSWIRQAMLSSAFRSSSIISQYPFYQKQQVPQDKCLWSVFSVQPCTYRKNLRWSLTIASTICAAAARIPKQKFPKVLRSLLLLLWFAQWSIQFVFFTTLAQGYLKL